MMSGEIQRLTVPCDSLAPVAVRRHLATLPDLGWVLGDAMLVATELVTNALRHSMCNEEDRLLVSVSRGADHVRICVTDPGTSGGTARIVEENDWFGGLGLRIVEQLATHWGSNRGPGGYEVWAQLPFVDSELRVSRELAGAAATGSMSSSAAPE
jgi:serine/threonine-protein kinase RsbW